MALRQRQVLIMVNKAHVLPRSSTMIERLHRLYEVFKHDDRVLIVINADPDAIASALALKRLLWRRVSTVTIARTNVVKRPDNLALIKFCKLQLKHVGDVKISEYSVLTMVDSQPHHMEGMSDLPFQVVIDHHPLGDCQAPFLDVRPDYGANATILTEYLRAARITPSRSLATALFYGVKTDTQNFARQGLMEDMRAFRFLFPLINQTTVRKIENSEITRSNLKHFRQALEAVKISKEMAFVYMGKVDNPDTLVIIAEFFMRVHDITGTVAAGIVKDHLVTIFRVVGHRKNAGKWAADSLGEFGSAGGHKAMARAEAPLSNLNGKFLEKEGALERFLFRRITKPLSANKKNKKNSSEKFS